MDGQCYPYGTHSFLLFFLGEWSENYMCPFHSGHGISPLEHVQKLDPITCILHEVRFHEHDKGSMVMKIKEEKKRGFHRWSKDGGLLFFN